MSGHPDLPHRLRAVLQSMQLVARSIPCTNAFRENMRHELRALQLWHGLPSLFVTLNPADTKHPFTLRFASDSVWAGLDESGSFDAALAAVMSRVHLAHAVAVDPIATARAFHQHVLCFFADLLGIHLAPQQLPADGLATAFGHGVLGPIAAVYGITEPQLRGSLHLHMLVHLYGLHTIEALLRRFRSRLPELRARLIAWSNSILGASLESLPATLHTPEAMETFQRLQPLPFSQRQEAVLHAQLGASWDFQVAGTHWRLGQLPLVPACAPWFDPCSDAANGVPTFVPWPRTYLCVEAALSAETWTSMLLYDLRHTAVHSCLHDCRPRTCHKGRLGKAGFCRLGFWHWRDVAPWTAPDTWQRCHGLPLQHQTTVDSSASTSGTRGQLLPERHHPFHTRFNTSSFICTFLFFCYSLSSSEHLFRWSGLLFYLLNFKLAFAALRHSCMLQINHDVTLLLRAPPASDQEDSDASLAASMAASARAASYYISAYITKTHPHLSNLWLLLRSGHERLQEELRTHAQADNASYVAARTLTRMLTSAEKSSHKSMAEISHYLLGFPEAYATHSFKKLYVTNLVSCALQLLPVVSIEEQEPQSTFFLHHLQSDPTVGEGEQLEHFSVVTGHQEQDYLHRGEALAAWPLYFYVAAFERCTASRLPTASAYAHYAPSHPQATRAVQRLRLDSPWVIPQLCGINLPAPDQDLELHCLMLLLLFKPWVQADLGDLLPLLGGRRSPTWSSALNHYREQLTAIVDASPPGTRAAPFTTLYWAQRCLARSPVQLRHDKMLREPRVNPPRGNV